MAGTGYLHGWDVSAPPGNESLTIVHDRAITGAQALGTRSKAVASKAA